MVSTADEGTSYYYCTACGEPCDQYVPEGASTNKEQGSHTPRINRDEADTSKREAVTIAAKYFMATSPDCLALARDIEALTRQACTAGYDQGYDDRSLEADHEIEEARTVAVEEERSRNLSPSDMLLAENKRLKEAGDALYERASYTGRTFDGTHRLLSAAAHWLDVRGKNSGEYQASLTQPEDAA